jgi:restriction endonuclease
MGITELVQDWGGFERLVAKLHETGEVTVERDVVLQGRSGAPRQIDVLIRHKQGLYEHLVVAECKYWNSRVERSDVDVVVATVRDVGASRGAIFSIKGFQSGAVLQAKHEGIELYQVRDLTREEWGLPGRIVDLFLQVIQPSIGNIRTDGAFKIGNPFVTTPITLPLAVGPEGFTSCTRTLKRDGSPGGELFEKYLADAVQQALSNTLAQVQMINGGAECTGYVGSPVNLVPDVPFKIPLNGEVLMIPRMSFDLGIKIQQSRITVDRAQRYGFALALENFITGAVSAASRPTDANVTTLAELEIEEPPSGEQALVNGTLMRVVMKAFFPFEEIASRTPIPIDQVRRPFVPPPLPPSA